MAREVWPPGSVVVVYGAKGNRLGKVVAASRAEGKVRVLPWVRSMKCWGQSRPVHRLQLLRVATPRDLQYFGFVSETDACTAS